MGSCYSSVSCLVADRKDNYPSCSLSFILYFLVQSLAKACLSFGSYNTSEYNLTCELQYWCQSSGGPRISHWGGADPLGGTNLRRVHFLVKTYAKTKEIDPVGRGAACQWHPPGSTNAKMSALRLLLWPALIG